jgi:CelD/BcsL family acetyltransferase involved in cellulose biosynthesis
VLTFLGDPLIQYGDAVAAPDATHQHFAAAFDAVAAGADLALLRKVRADARARAFLDRRAHAIAEEESPYVDLRAERSVHSRKCRRLRRLRRRLEEHGPLSLEITRGGAARAPLVEAIALKRAWLAERGLDSAVIGTRDWENTLLQLADESADTPLAVARLIAGGEVAAAEIALAHDGRWHAFLGAIAPRLARSGPGRLQIELTIERCRDDGFAIYDLLPPAESYKRAITNGAVAVRDYAIGYGALGGLALLAARAAWRIKPQLARLPAPLRRAALSAIGLRRAGR